jgi:hypothetical protein
MAKATLLCSYSPAEISPDSPATPAFSPSAKTRQLQQVDKKGSASGKNLKSGSCFRHSGGGRNPGLYANLLISKQKTLDPGLRRGDDFVDSSLLV